MTTRSPSPLARQTPRPTSTARAVALRPAWSKSALLDRAIQDLVRRWVAPSLVVVSGACSAVHDRPNIDAPAAGSSALAGSGGQSGGGAGASGAGGASTGNAGTDGAGSGGSGTTAAGSGGAAGTGAAGTGGAAGSTAPIDPLAPFAPDLPAEGSGYDTMDCGATGWDPMPHLKPAAEHEYAALRSGYVEDPAVQPASTLSETGARCATASDVDACSTALDALPDGRVASECGQAGCMAYWVMSSDGDTVEAWTSRDDLLAFLGEIDSPEDALLLVRFDGYELGHAVDFAFDPCTTAAVREVEDGYEVFGHKMTESCAPIRMTRYLLHVSPDGVVTVLGEATAKEDSACVGRRPEGLLEAERPHARGVLGAYLANNAHLEGAAVHAFDRMIDELRAYRAPQPLIDAAASARADEVRHTEQVGRLAERFGGVVPEVRVEALPLRSLFAIALENAVEGCVRETWGAVVGTYQAAHARDPELRAVMQALAADERRHATLSFELAAWLDGRLTAAERAEVAAAVERAIAELRIQLQTSPAEPLRLHAGLPDAATARALFEALDVQLLH